MSFPDFRITQIARVAYEAERAWQIGHGTNMQAGWDDLSPEAQDAVKNVVIYHLSTPVTVEGGVHSIWLAQREADGWKWGKVYNEDEKTDPSMVQFHLLPPENQASARLAIAIIKALSRV